MPIRVLIADDHRILRAGLRTLLSVDGNIEVVGEATNGDEAIHIAQKLCPDIVLMDISMPAGGLETTRKLMQVNPGVRVLMLTMHEDQEIVREYLNAGVHGYIIKRAAESELIDAIYAVWRGMIYVHPSMMRTLVTPKQKTSQPESDEEEPLTPREVEVLRMIVRGYTNRQIASELNISTRTVETHRSNLMDKLNLHSRVELIRYATKHGLEKYANLE